MSTTKLDPAFKAKWIAALLSGQYKQCRGQLKSAGRHCCLGVARDACGVSTSTSDYAGFLLDRESIAAVGLTDGIQRHLYHMNDIKGNSFADIAQYIQDNL